MGGIMVNEFMTSAVVKVSSKCNLNCTYCYMYNLEDRSFHDQVPFMSSEVAHALIRAVSLHCQAHDVPTFTFIFHGGEPLLARNAFFDDFVTTAKELIPASTKLAFSIQTNGILLDTKRSEMLKSLGIRVGVSIDGPRDANDRYRVDHKGRGSYDRVLKGWHVAQEQGLAPGLLTVVDVTQDVRTFYSHIQDLNPRKADVLLPDANYAQSPERPLGDREAYGKWLYNLFELWVEDASTSFEIRLFNTLISAILADPGDKFAFSKLHNGIFTINPDGGLETLDLLKACDSNSAATPYNITTDALDALFQVPVMRLYYYERQAVCGECRECPYLRICGGGWLPHRYSRENEFDNPSIYCDDLKYLFRKVIQWIKREASEQLISPDEELHLCEADSK